MTTSLPPVPKFSPVPPVPSPVAGIPGAGALGEVDEVFFGHGVMFTSDVFRQSTKALGGRGRFVGNVRVRKKLRGTRAE
jgi:hypothetical protein